MFTVEIGTYYISKYQIHFTHEVKRDKAGNPELGIFETLDCFRLAKLGVSRTKCFIIGPNGYQISREVILDEADFEKYGLNPDLGERLALAKLLKYLGWPREYRKSAWSAFEKWKSEKATVKETEREITELVSRYMENENGSLYFLKQLVNAFSEKEVY